LSHSGLPLQSFGPEGLSGICPLGSTIGVSLASTGLVVRHWGFPISIFSDFISLTKTSFLSKDPLFRSRL